MAIEERGGVPESVWAAGGLEVVVYLDVGGGGGVFRCGWRWWCIKMWVEVVVY